MDLVNVYITNLQNALNEEMKKRILAETQFQIAQQELQTLQLELNTLKNEYEKKILKFETQSLEAKKKPKPE